MKHFAEEVRVLVGAKDIFSSPIPFRNFKMKVFPNKEQLGGERYFCLCIGPIQPFSSLTLVPL